MQRTILLISIFLLSAMWVAAQSESAQNLASGPPGTRATVEGCLYGAGGHYTLTLPSGAIFQLTGNTAQLKSHIGGTVRVIGIAIPVVHVPGSMSEGTVTQPTFRVSSFQGISGVCSETNSIP